MKTEGIVSPKEEIDEVAEVHQRPVKDTTDLFDPFSWKKDVPQGVECRHLILNDHPIIPDEAIVQGIPMNRKSDHHWNHPEKFLHTTPNLLVIDDHSPILALFWATTIRFSPQGTGIKGMAVRTSITVRKPKKGNWSMAGITGR